MIYGLLIIEIILFVIIYSLEKYDFFAPPCIVLLVWIFSTLCAIYNIEYWGVNLSKETLEIYAESLLTFSIASIAIDYMCRNKKAIVLPESEQKKEYYSQKWVSRFAFLNLICLLLVTYSVWKKAGISGLFANDNYSSLMASYRDSKEKLPFIVRQIYKKSRLAYGV